MSCQISNVPPSCIPRCANKCSDQVVVSKTPTPGSVVGNTTVVSNTATVVFKRTMKLLSFNINGPTGTLGVTLSSDVGSFDTTFTATPQTTLPVGTYTAFVRVVDTLLGCKRDISWSWTVST